MSDPHTPPPAELTRDAESNAGRSTPSGARSSWALAIVALLCTALIANRAVAERRQGDPDRINLLVDHGVVIGSDTAPAQAPTVERAFGMARVSDARGRRVALAVADQPTIIMISSRTCSWCKRALKDLGEMSAGRPLPRLTLLTLENAADGAPMLALEHITGARLVGPASPADRALITDRFPGTPTFVEVDRNGRVIRTLPGYPIREELKLWFETMKGES